MTAPVADIARELLTGDTLTASLDYASVAVFALTGALVASRAQLDIVGFIFIACLTAVGGGTLRDVILDRPVFWIADPAILLVAAIAAVLVFLTAHRLESLDGVLLWLDACALAVAVPAGVAAAQSVGMGWPIVLVAGMVAEELIYGTSVGGADDRAQLGRLWGLSGHDVVTAQREQRQARREVKTWLKGRQQELEERANHLAQSAPRLGRPLATP